MVNLKTKIEKHLNDDEKRRKSIKAKEKAKLSQTQLIKQALTENNLSKSSKKIVFSNEDDTVNDEISEDKNDLNGNGKPTLFDGSDSENETFEFKEKTQFSGKKGFELLNLQSTYGNDDRFKIDERFLENEDDVDEDKNKSTYDGDSPGEKAKQLKLLEDVLGSSVVGLEKEKKKKRTYEMVRYDASNKDHEIFEKKEQTQAEKLRTPKKRKESKTQKSDREELPKPKVSKDKFYKVSSEIKSCFKEKQEGGGQFSLLQTYSVNSCIKDEEVEGGGEEEEEEVVGEYNELDYSVDNRNEIADIDFERAVQEEEEVTEQKSNAQEKTVTAKGIWKETFFIDQDDARFEEGLKFINKKDSSEAIEAAEKFDETRKRLKEILRLHIKKQMHRKDPFKNKIGGMNKKQLASSKFRNPKMLHNRRKPPRRNFERTT